MNRHFFFALLLLVSRMLFAAEDNDPGFRVVQERSADGVTLIMKSDYCVEFTVTLEATLTNMTSSRLVPFTVDAAGRSSFVLARFKQSDKSRPWRYNYYYHWEYGGRRNSTTNDADYAMPFRPGRYVVLHAPRGTYSPFVGSASENAVDWDVPEG